MTAWCMLTLPYSVLVYCRAPPPRALLHDVVYPQLLPTRGPSRVAKHNNNARLFSYSSLQAYKEQTPAMTARVRSRASPLFYFSAHGVPCIEFMPGFFSITLDISPRGFRFVFVANKARDPQQYVQQSVQTCHFFIICFLPF